MVTDKKTGSGTVRRPSFITGTLTPQSISAIDNAKKAYVSFLLFFLGIVFSYEFKAYYSKPNGVVNHRHYSYVSLQLFLKNQC